MTKPDEIDFIVQLILANCVFWITKTLPVGPQKFFLVFFGTPQVDPFVKFYCMFNALVRPNLKRWTGFDVLIIFGVKF